jgi:hypothetical protein
MDLVSFETADEYQYFKNIMQSTNVQGSILQNSISAENFSDHF